MGDPRPSINLTGQRKSQRQDPPRVTERSGSRAGSILGPPSSRVKHAAHQEMHLDRSLGQDLRAPVWRETSRFMPDHRRQHLW